MTIAMSTAQLLLIADRVYAMPLANSVNDIRCGAAEDDRISRHADNLVATPDHFDTVFRTRGKQAGDHPVSLRRR